MFRERLQNEFDARRQSNARYSLRAFAAFLETDHSTLSQVLKGQRRAPVRQLRAWCRKLDIPPEEITIYLAAEHVPDAVTAERQAQLRHWTAEAMAIVSAPVHWHIVRLSRDAAFRADCRWLAAQTGVTIDEVNLALTRLLRLGLVDGQWKDRTGLRALDEGSFRRLALARVQEKAAEDHIKFTPKG